VSNERVMGDRWMMEWKGYARKRSCPNLRHYPDICLGGLRKKPKTSVRITDLRGVWTPDPPNTKPECYVWCPLCIYLFVCLQTRRLYTIHADKNAKRIMFNVKMTALLYTEPCNLLELDQRFTGAYCALTHHPDDGDSNHLWNVCKLIRDYMAK
jgi:hypothetical protein